MKQLLLMLLLVSPIFAETAVGSSTKSVNDVVKMLKAQMNAKKLSILAEIDHLKNAKSVGKTMSDAQVIIFGNPVVGTDLMLENPAMSAVLPLQISVYYDPKAKKTMLVAPLLPKAPKSASEDYKKKVDTVNGLLKSLASLKF